MEYLLFQSSIENITIFLKALYKNNNQWFITYKYPTIHLFIIKI